MEIILFRDNELASELRQLSAETYNTARVLLVQSEAGNLFVPIRSMQYLAIVDSEEIVFVDSASKNRVAIAWTDFKPQQRSGLLDPVSYMARYYCNDSETTMQRLQGEFLLALRAMQDKQPRSGSARIISLADKPD